MRCFGELERWLLFLQLSRRLLRQRQLRLFAQLPLIAKLSFVARLRLVALCLAAAERRFALALLCLEPFGKRGSLGKFRGSIYQSVCRLLFPAFHHGF